MWHLRGRREMYTVFGGGGLKQRAHLKDPGVDGGIILKRIFSG